MQCKKLLLLKEKVQYEYIYKDSKDPDQNVNDAQN